MTSDWARVKWTEARQVIGALDWTEAPDEPGHGLPPAAFFDALQARGRHVEAAQFLGQALPRWEAVAWAARAVRDLRLDDARKPAEAHALKTALLWVQDPTEARRRAAFEAAEAAPPACAERLTALAAFFSGGSIAPLNCAPVQAPREAAGRLAAGAVLLMALRADQPGAALERCLAAGAALAQDGAG